MRDTERKKVQTSTSSISQTRPSSATRAPTRRRANNSLAERPSSRQAQRPKQNNAVASDKSSLPKRKKFASPGNADLVASEPESLNTDTTSQVYEEVDIHYVDDLHVYRSEESNNKGDILNEGSRDLEKESSQVEDQGSDSDTDTVNDSVSSQTTTDDEKVKKASSCIRITKKTEAVSRAPRLGANLNDKVSNKSPLNCSTNGDSLEKKPLSSSNFTTAVCVDNDSSKIHSDEMRDSTSSESSEVIDDKLITDEVSNGANVTVAEVDEETADHVQHNHNVEKRQQDEKVAGLNLKVEEMESRIEKLEEELREVAALEISLYSVAPEHGSSAHKVHTPARRLSRLYIHASKYGNPKKRASVAKNIVSGLVLISKTCGNDVARLTFWLSNTVVLREIISQAFGTSCQSSMPSLPESNGKEDHVMMTSLVQFVEDWQDTRTFIAGLVKIESWLFSRIVESVWWQALMPSMQTPVEDLIAQKTVPRMLGLAQDEENFSIELWKNAFEDTFKVLCPVRAAGLECGCLPVIAKMVMEQCAARLDVAMFNALLRESAHQIPTDPVSDPIADSRVLPVPAGDLSFGSGAQLKNAIGNWSRCLSDVFGVGTTCQINDGNSGNGQNDGQAGRAKIQSFSHLDELSDLLMLPKDLLMDRSIRKEVCPSISLPLVKRILCNFSPDEFCPDSVPGEVLELLNAESLVEQRLSGGKASSFPYAAAAVVYCPPSSADVAEKVAEAGRKHQLDRNVSMVQKKGYTSDEELEDLDSPLASVIDNFTPYLTSPRYGNGSLKPKQHTSSGGVNTRYELLREVWSV